MGAVFFCPAVAAPMRIDERIEALGNAPTILKPLIFNPKLSDFAGQLFHRV